MTSDEPVFVPPGAVSEYAFTYLIPESVSRHVPVSIVLHFHGSIALMNEKGTAYRSQSYKDQVHEIMARYASRFAQDLLTDFVHLYPYSPRDTTSDEYPQCMRDAQAFTKETIVGCYLGTEESDLYAQGNRI